MQFRKQLLPNEDRYTLSVTGTNASVTVKRANRTITSGTEIYVDDVLKITATAASGYELSTLTVNGVSFTSGQTYTVQGNTTIVAVAKAKVTDIKVLDAEGGTDIGGFTFNAATTSYSVSVANEVESVYIDVTTADTATGGGTKALEVGANAFEIYAGSGDTKSTVYTVTITRAEP